jgi:hypothetical protein
VAQRATDQPTAISQEPRTAPSKPSNTSRFRKAPHMRTKFMMLLTVLTLMATGSFALASPAAAAPAEVYSESWTYDYGDGYVVTYAVRGVTQLVDSGKTQKWTFNGEWIYTATYNGEPVYSDVYEDHYTQVVRAGELQVDHPRGTSFSYGDYYSCTYSYGYIIANGEFRAELYDSQCS